MLKRHIWVKGWSQDQRDPEAKLVEGKPAQTSHWGCLSPLQGWEEQAQSETGKIKGAKDSYFLLLNYFSPESQPRPGNKSGP